MKQTRNEKGFSMIELIVVVAIMAIIGAVLIPQFSTMSQRARLTTDATTVKTFQNQVDAYIADVGSKPGTITSNANLNSDVITALLNQGYIQSTYLTSSNTKLAFQTSGATCYYDGTLGHFILKVPSDAFNTLRTSDPNRNVWIKSN